MAGIYPNDQSINMGGKTVTYPGMGADGKFTDGDFADPAKPPSFLPATTINFILDMIAKAITDAGLAPDSVTIAQLSNALVGTSAATVSKIVRRDAAGRAQVASPSATADIATKGYVDTADSTHANLQTAHGAVSAATASKMMIRDASGRSQVADPAAAADISTKGYTDKGAMTEIASAVSGDSLAYMDALTRSGIVSFAVGATNTPEGAATGVWRYFWFSTSAGDGLVLAYKAGTAGFYTNFLVGTVWQGWDKMFDNSTPLPFAAGDMLGLIKANGFPINGTAAVGCTNTPEGTATGVWQYSYSGDGANGLLWAWKTGTNPGRLYYNVLSAGTWKGWRLDGDEIGTVKMFDANNPGPIVTAGNFVVGRQYKIVSVGTTNFVSIGASASTVGITFTATGVGSGTGTAYDLTYASSAWADNVTMPGWYACIPANSVYGCPDLTNRFVMGKDLAGVGATGGTNSYQITAANLPVHTHVIDHDHASVTSAAMSANQTHSHGVTDPGHVHAYYLPDNDGVSNTISATGSSDASTGHNTNSAVTGITINTSASLDHTHAVDLPAFTGSSGNGGFANTAIDNRPAFYSLIFIKKCA